MPALQLSGISKRYRISYDKPALVREILPRFMRPRREVDYWALHALDLEVPKGRSLAIVGLNGAGKTTLLGIMAGITQPTTGSVFVHGKVASLMSVGSGFHPELTGRENIFLNGTLLGMTTRQIRHQLDSISAFSGLDRFIDAPLSTYSAGMQLRLGFAVAIHAESDILMMDEVLAVGDIEFEKRCLDRLRRIRRSGRTLIFITQNLGLVESLSDHALLLHRGRKVERGLPRRIVRSYRHLSERAGAGRSVWLPSERREFIKRLSTHNVKRVQKEWGRRFERPEASILSLRFLNKRGRVVSKIHSGDALTVEVLFEFHKPIRDPHIGVALFRSDQAYVFGPNSRFDNYRFNEVLPGRGRCAITFDVLPLSAGEYRVSIALWERYERFHYSYDCGYYPVRVEGRPAEASGLCTAPYFWHADRPAVQRRVRTDRRTRDDYLKKVQAVQTQAHPARSPRLKVRVSKTHASPFLHDTDLLQWGEAMEFVFDLTAACASGGSHAWIGIAREPDGLLCAGWSTWEENVLLFWPPGDSQIRLRIPQWPLTTGRYRVMSIIWNSEGALEHYDPHALSLTVGPGRPDHGMMYLPHRWNIQLPQKI